MTIFDTRRFLLQKLKEANPDIETRSGSATGSILVKPLSVMINPFSDEIDFIRTQLSLSDVSSLSSDNVDQLISNLFIDRRIGTLATGTVRLFFSSAQDSTVTSGTGFLDRESRLFLASGTTSISRAEMSLNRDGSLFFFDIPIVASAEGDEFNVGANQIISSETDILGVVRITNPNPLTQGLPGETDQEFVDRAQLAITVRNLINRRSISTVLLNEFNFLVSLQSIGFRDPEMLRDLIEVQTSNGLVDLNIGGHADIYIEPATTSDASVTIPDTAMTGDLKISTNEDRGLVSESVKAGLFIDIAPGFFGEFEVEEQFGVKLDSSSTYHIYLDSAGVLQFDNVSGSFPASSIPLAIVTTDSSKITNVTDSRANIISFPRPMVSIDNVVELDPVTLTETDRFLTDGRSVLNDTTLNIGSGLNPDSSDMALTVTDDVFVVFVSSNDVYVAGFDSSGTQILAPTNVSDPTDTVSSISRNPSLTISPTGKLNVIFEDDRNGQFDVFYTRTDQSGAIEVAITTVSGATTGVIDTVHDDDESGNLHVSWLDGTNSEYRKIDEDGVAITSVVTVSSTTNSKSETDISTNGNTVTTSTTGRANGSTSFEDPTTTFPGSVLAGQTLVLTGGTLDFSAILDGTETEPPPFAATITGSVSAANMDTSISSGFNTFEVVVDGVTVFVTFTDTASNPIATVISEINTVSNGTALATNIASNSGNDEVVITSPTTGTSSTINVTIGNDGIGFTTSDSDQGGSGYNTSVLNGTNTFNLTVDGVDLDVTFTDTKGNTLTNVLSEINAVSNASSLGTNVAFDNSSAVQIVSPSTGLTSEIEIDETNSALGFTSGDREEGGTELGKRVGIDTVVGPTEITLSEPLRTISTTDDVQYSIESIEASIVWVEDNDIFLAKLDDTPTVFFGPSNMTRLEVKPSAVATPATDAMTNGPGSNEITFDDSSATFQTTGVKAGDTLRVTSASPLSAEDDYIIKDVQSETILILTGTLPSSPANSVTYEIFETFNSEQPAIDNNTDNELQLFWIDNNRRLSRIETDRVGTILKDTRSLLVRSENITSLDIFTDLSDFSHLGWVENSINSGDPHYARVDEFGNITLEPTLVEDSSEISSSFNVESNSENEPSMIWISTDFSTNPESRTIRYNRRTAQDYFIKVNDPSVNLSIKEDRTITFSNEFINQPIGFNYQTSPEVKIVEDFIQDPSNQIIDSNYLTKHVVRANVSTTVNYVGDVTNAQQVVIDFINGVTDTTLEASDISDALYEAGALQVVLPFTMSVEYTDVDGVFVSSENQDEITIPRLARFFADTNTITVNNVS